MYIYIVDIYIYIYLFICICTNQKKQSSSGGFSTSKPQSLINQDLWGNVTYTCKIGVAVASTYVDNWDRVYKHA